MRALTPWTGTNLRREMDRLFERFLDAHWNEPPSLGAWTPAIDVTEGPDSLVIKADLPGVNPKDIAVMLEGNLLTIKGEKEQKREDKAELAQGVGCQGHHDSDQGGLGS